MASVADFFGAIRRRALRLGNERYPQARPAPAAGLLDPNKQVLARVNRIVPIWQKCDVTCVSAAVHLEISGRICRWQTSAGDGQHSDQTYEPLHNLILHAHRVRPTRLTGNVSA